MQKQKAYSFSSWRKLVWILCLGFSGEAFAGLSGGGGSLGSITDSTTPPSKFETQVSERVQIDYSLRDFQTLLVQEVLQPHLANLRTTGLDGGEISVRDRNRRQVMETAWDHRSLEDYFEALCEGFMGGVGVSSSETDLRSLCGPVEVQDHIFRLYIDNLVLQASVPEDYVTLVFIDDSTLNFHVRLLNVRLQFDLLAKIYSVKREKVIAEKTIHLRPNIRELSLEVKIPIRLKETGILQVGPVDLDELKFNGLSLSLFDELQQVFERLDGERVYRFIAWTACRDLVRNNSDASGQSLFEKCMNTRACPHSCLSQMRVQARKTMALKLRANFS